MQNTVFYTQTNTHTSGLSSQLRNSDQQQHDKKWSETGPPCHPEPSPQDGTFTPLRTPGPHSRHTARLRSFPYEKQISGKHSICTKCELADVIIDQGQGHGEPEVEFRAQKTAFLTPTFNHTNWRQGQEIQQLLGYLRRTEKCLRGGWKAHDTREPPSARPSDPIDSRHKNARLC